MMMKMDEGDDVLVLLQLYGDNWGCVVRHLEAGPTSAVKIQVIRVDESWLVRET